MTRTKDQTYLARLGFSDPDKKNELHDAACLYLAQEEKARKLLEGFVYSGVKDRWQLYEDRNS